MWYIILSALENLQLHARIPLLAIIPFAMDGERWIL
jgi:hypothetical protein